LSKLKTRKMKKIVLTLLSVSLLLASCKKIDKFTQFNKEYNSEITISSLVGTNLPFNLPTPAINTNLEKDMEVNDSKKELIEEALLKILTVSIKSPANQNFDFVNDIDIYINSDNFPKKKIAYLHSIPENNAKKLTFTIIEGMDIQEYIKEDSFKLELKIKTDKTIFQDVVLDIYTKIYIDAKILGL